MKSGKQNEIDILTALSGRMVKDLNQKWKKHIKKMFPEAKEDDVVHAYFYHDSYAKPDIVITINTRSVMLSIKSGKNPSCHLEYYSDFADFLIKMGVPARYIRIIAFYQFGRSEKLSNQGLSFTREEIQTQFEKYIKETNEYFLNHSSIVKRIIYRAIIRGVRYRVDPIDYFYYGNVDRGFLLSVEEIYKEILQDPNTQSKAIHFYGLVFQPDGKREDRDNYLKIRIKWPLLAVKFNNDDFIESH